MLYIVSTPIGNLGDLSFRAVEILKQVPLIAAEDTRQTGILLKHYGITTPMISYHSQSGSLKLEKLLEHLQAGQDLALVSDAGTPAISDPGGELIREALKLDIAITAVPGPSAFLNALVLSGFSTKTFKFAGFIPHKKGRQTFIQSLKESDCTTVFYESSHRIQKLMNELLLILGSEREICVARELTKMFEEVLRGPLSEVSAKILSKTPKGEYVVVVRTS